MCFRLRVPRIFPSCESRIRAGETGPELKVFPRSGPRARTAVSSLLSSVRIHRRGPCAFKSRRSSRVLNDPNSRTTLAKARHDSNTVFGLGGRMKPAGERHTSGGGYARSSWPATDAGERGHPWAGLMGSDEMLLPE